MQSESEEPKLPIQIRPVLPPPLSASLHFCLCQRAPLEIINPDRVEDDAVADGPTKTRTIIVAMDGWMAYKSSAKSEYFNVGSVVVVLFSPNPMCMSVCVCFRACLTKEKHE